MSVAATQRLETIRGNYADEGEARFYAERLLEQRQSCFLVRSYGVKTEKGYRGVAEYRTMATGLSGAK